MTVELHLVFNININVEIILSWLIEEILIFQLSPKVNVFKINATHDTILKDEHVGKVADVINEYINAKPVNSTD